MSSPLFRSLWWWVCAALTPLSPALAAPDDVRAVVRDVAEELPRSLALRRGEAVRLSGEGYVVDSADGDRIDLEYGGHLVALSEGSATLRALRGGVLSDPIPVEVSGSPVSSMRMDGAPVFMRTGEAVRMRAIAYRLDFTLDDVTSIAVWTTTDPDVLRVDDAGRIIGVSPGIAVVDAWTDGQVARSGLIRVE